ncbi:hypothetical protein [Nonomuraea sp. NPDC048826]|uniref:hypothetical protein n=1 Tax=Nonomuraea sp. NPDC048826 TaxID=3364347 RepID=UPI003714D118
MMRPRRLSPSAFARLLRKHTRGPFRLAGARITGDLDLARLDVDFDVELRECLIDGALILDGLTGKSVEVVRTRARTVRASRVKLFGGLSLAETRIGSVNGVTKPLPGLWGEGVDEAVAPHRVTHHGAAPALLDLSGADVAGDLDLREARIAAADQWSLFAANLRVGGSVRGTRMVASGALYLREIRVDGAVDLSGAQIGGLDATGARINGSVHADWGFTSPGQVRLRGTVANGTVTFHDAVLGPGGLHLAGLRAPRLRLDFRQPLPGRIMLRDVEVDSLVDAQESWPVRLDLEGFTYRRISRLGVRERLKWLALDPHLGPGAFEQLALFYGRIGDEGAARLVRRARQRHIRAHDKLPAKAWGVIQNVLFGYGYAPGRALAWLLLLVTAGSLWFGARPPRPARKDGPNWDAVLYALDLIVPFANLGQRNAWDPCGVDRAVAVGLILSGWLLATAVIAGIGRVLNRG